MAAQLGDHRQCRGGVGHRFVVARNPFREQAAAHFKGGDGFHPIYCFADATGETLGVLLRPGNAGANTIADHVTVLDQAIAQLPAEIAVGHHDGEDPALVRRAVRVRCDSAGCTDFVWQARPAQRRVLRRRPLQRQYSGGDQQGPGRR